MNNKHKNFALLNHCDYLLNKVTKKYNITRKTDNEIEKLECINFNELNDLEKKIVNDYIKFNKYITNRKLNECENNIFVKTILD